MYEELDAQRQEKKVLMEAAATLAAAAAADAERERQRGGGKQSRKRDAPMLNSKATEWKKGMAPCWFCNGKHLDKVCTSDKAKAYREKNGQPLAAAALYDECGECDGLDPEDPFAQPFLSPGTYVIPGLVAAATVPPAAPEPLSPVKLGVTAKEAARNEGGEVRSMAPTKDVAEPEAPTPPTPPPTPPPPPPPTPPPTRTPSPRLWSPRRSPRARPPWRPWPPRPWPWRPLGQGRPRPWPSRARWTARATRRQRGPRRLPPC